MQRELAQRLHDAWKATSLTKVELAERMGVDDGHVGRMTRGERLGEVSVAILVKFAEACNEDPVALIFGRKRLEVLSRDEFPEDWTHILIPSGAGHVIQSRTKKSPPVNAKKPQKRHR